MLKVRVSAKLNWYNNDLLILLFVSLEISISNKTEFIKKIFPDFKITYKTNEL